MPGKTIRTLSEQLPCFIAKLFPVIRPLTLSAAQAVAYFSDDESTLIEEEVRAPVVGQNGEGWPRGTQEGCEWS